MPSIPSSRNCDSISAERSLAARSTPVRCRLPFYRALNDGAKIALPTQQQIAGERALCIEDFGAVRRGGDIGVGGDHAGVDRRIDAFTERAVRRRATRAFSKDSLTSLAARAR